MIRFNETAAINTVLMFLRKDKAIKLQLICLNYYNSIIPNSMPLVPINLVSIKMDTLFASENSLDIAGNKALETFRRIPRMSCARFFAASGELAKDIDWNRNSIFKTWENPEGVKYAGMCMKLTGKMHGIIRMVNPKGAIEEGMYKNGRRHGLVRNIPNNGEYECYNWMNG